MNGQLRIEEMYAFVVLDEDNTEGIPAIEGMLEGRDIAMPLVGANMAMIEFLRPHAEFTARRLGKKVTLVKFTNRVELEVILPASSEKPS